jgi:multidrug efflux system membrane fusion protein
MSSETAATHTSPPSRWKLWIAGFILLAGGVFAYQRYFSAAPAPQERQRFFPRGQSVPVRVVPAKNETIEVQIKALGTVTPINTVTVRSRVDGELVRVLFNEGQRVAAGQLLAEIDPRPFQSQLDQVLGQQQENQARLKNAQGDLERYRKLAGEGLITQQQVTTQDALVQQYSGALTANDAQVANARLQLSYTRITAPIDGRLGLRQVDAGNLIRSGDPNGLVVITQMRPISVIFTVPETELPAVLEAYRRGNRPPVEAWDRAESALIAKGTLETVDNQIDTTTGTIKLRAEFVNADEQLFPNQFVNIRLRVQSLRDATVIPSAAVQRASFGPFVYVVKPDFTVAIRRITLGPAEGNRVAITEGVKAGEQVVLEGVDDLTENAKVEVIGEDGKVIGGGAPAGGGPGGRRGPGGPGGAPGGAAGAGGAGGSQPSGPRGGPGGGGGGRP